MPEFIIEGTKTGRIYSHERRKTMPTFLVAGNSNGKSVYVLHETEHKEKAVVAFEIKYPHATIDKVIDMADFVDVLTT